MDFNEEIKEEGPKCLFDDNEIGIQNDFQSKDKDKNVDN